jgi:hypothetical protein
MSAVMNPFESARTAPAQTVSSEAMASQQREMAETQAKLVMAERFPRNEVQCMDRILNAFTRPGLAEVAKYQYSKGGSDVDGPSIRSAEAVAQLWGNMEFGFREKSRGRGADGVTYSEVEAFAWDLQSRTRRPAAFQVRHWRDTKKGGYPLTDEREIYELMANMAQRRVRACILAVIPGDVIEAAMNQAEATLRTKADTSPEAMAKMVEAFAQFEVTKEHIEKRIQRRLDAITPAQVVTLKKVYASLRDGMSAAHEWFDIEPPAPPVDPALDALNAIGNAIGKGSAPKKTPPPKRVEAAEVLTYAQVLDAMNKAASRDTLDIAADMIGSVADEDQRAELTAIYKKLRG